MEETLDSTEAQAGTAPERVGFGPRFGAFVLDLIFAAIVGYIFSSIGVSAGANAGAATGADEAEAAGNAVAGGIVGMIAGMILGIVGYMLIEAFTGASPGKMILGLQIGTADGGKGDIGLYMKRWLVKNVNLVLVLISVFAGVAALYTVGQILGFVIFIGCFFVLAEHRQAFQDMIAKSAVYRKKELKK